MAFYGAVGMELYNPRWQSRRPVEWKGWIMRGARKNIVLFLCTGNYYRSRFAEILFNSVAGRMNLPWKASSRGLALQRGINNGGPIAVAAIEALEARGLRAVADCARFPIQVTGDDFEMANWIVALKQAEHLPLLQERFPAWAQKVEFWHVDDAPEVLALIEREVMGLMARLIGGGRRREEAMPEIATEVVGTNKETSKKSAPVVRLRRETKGRRGKGVTTVSDVPLDETSLLDLAAKLKNRCGTGGTVKDGIIEIQGDQRDRLAGVLEEMGYRVKRVGG
jgi:predicted translation initiation factor SUI1